MYRHKKQEIKLMGAQQENAKKMNEKLIKVFPKYE